MCICAGRCDWLIKKRLTTFYTLTFECFYQMYKSIKNNCRKRVNKTMGEKTKHSSVLQLLIKPCKHCLSLSKVELTLSYAYSKLECLSMNIYKIPAVYRNFGTLVGLKKTYYQISNM